LKNPTAIVKRNPISRLYFQRKIMPSHNPQNVRDVLQTARDEARTLSRGNATDKKAAQLLTDAANSAPVHSFVEAALGQYPRYGVSLFRTFRKGDREPVVDVGVALLSGARKLTLTHVSSLPSIQEAVVGKDAATLAGRAGIAHLVSSILEADSGSRITLADNPRRNLKHVKHSTIVQFDVNGRAVQLFADEKSEDDNILIIGRITEAPQGQIVPNSHGSRNHFIVVHNLNLKEYDIYVATAAMKDFAAFLDGINQMPAPRGRRDFNPPAAKR
jgi:hypothetical protein